MQVMTSSPFSPGGSTSRTDDMLKIRGVNVFPSQIEEVLLGIEEIGPHYEIIVTPFSSP